MIRLALTAVVAMGLAGCASFSEDGGFGQVADLTRERTLPDNTLPMMTGAGPRSAASAWAACSASSRSAMT